MLRPYSGQRSWRHRYRGDSGGRSHTRSTPTTIPDQDAAPVADLLERDFTPGEIDQQWCGDITYLPVNDSWLYLATVIHTGSRRLISWSIADHLRTELVSDALTAAIRSRRPE